MTPTIKDLLLEHHLKYQQQQNRRVTAREFAEYIGLSYSFYGHLANGVRDPGIETVRQLALFFDDQRFYDAAKFPRPNPLVYGVSLVIDKMSEVDKKKISDIVSKYKTS